MSPPDFNFNVGGPFKFKGATDAGIDKKRKKKKSKQQSSDTKDVTSNDTNDAATKSKPEDRSVDKDTASELLKAAPYKTKAELNFEQRRRERLQKQANQGVAKTHKDRVREFNEKLARQTDHHDMPRIGPG